MSNVPDKTYMEQKQEYKDLAELAIHESMKRSRLLESDWDDIMLDIENEQFEDLRKHQNRIIKLYQDLNTVNQNELVIERSDDGNLLSKDFGFRLKFENDGTIFITGVYDSVKCKYRRLNRDEEQIAFTMNLKISDEAKPCSNPKRVEKFDESDGYCISRKILESFVDPKFRYTYFGFWNTESPTYQELFPKVNEPLTPENFMNQVKKGNIPGIKFAAKILEDAMTLKLPFLYSIERYERLEEGLNDGVEYTSLLIDKILSENPDENLIPGLKFFGQIMDNHLNHDDNKEPLEFGYYQHKLVNKTNCSDENRYDSDLMYQDGTPMVIIERLVNAMNNASKYINSKSGYDEVKVSISTLTSSSGWTREQLVDAIKNTDSKCFDREVKIYDEIYKPPLPGMSRIRHLKLYYQALYYILVKNTRPDLFV